MKRSFQILTPIAVAAVVGATLMGLKALPAPAGQASPADTRLPGSRPAIDAAHYPSLQAAFDAVPAEGGVVRIPPGTFDVVEPLIVRRSDVLIQGAGSATHIRNTNTAGLPAIRIEHPAGAKAKADDRLWRVQLADLRITGNAKSGHGIHAVEVNEVFLSGVTVSRHGGIGILLDRCYEDPRVCNCLITYNTGTGLALPGCHDIVVAANQFEENKTGLRCTDAFNLCLTGNCFDDHLGDGVIVENTYGSVLSGNMIEECNGTGVILDRDCYGITVSANVIAHNDSGVDLRDAHGCSVSANTFTINAGFGLRVGPNSGRITVTGNNFSNSYLGGGQVKRAATDLRASGLRLEGTSDVAVSGNVFAGVRPKAVEAAGSASRRVLFAGNVLTDSDSDHAVLKDSVVGPLVPNEGPPAKSSK